MGKDEEKFEQLVATKKREGKSHTASVAGLGCLSPEKPEGGKPKKAVKTIRVTVADIKETKQK